MIELRVLGKIELDLKLERRLIHGNGDSVFATRMMLLALEGGVFAVRTSVSATLLPCCLSRAAVSLLTTGQF